MPRGLSDLTLILHRIDSEGSSLFEYQRQDKKVERVKPEDIKFLKKYPNPVLVSHPNDPELSLSHLELRECLELVHDISYIPDEANALVVGRGAMMDNKWIYPALYCRFNKA